MLRLFLSALCAVLSAIALPDLAEAQDLPALYNVTDVASDDVLNVRSGPGASNPVIGELAHDATHVEITAIDGNWGRTNVFEQSGWVSMRYLAAVSGGTLPDWQTLDCGGTEPFWDVNLTQNATATFRSPEMTEGEVYSASALQSARGRFWPWAAFGESPGGLMSLVVTPAECGDGMSDRDYGLSTTLILRRPGQAPEFYEGCCSLGQ